MAGRHVAHEPHEERQATYGEVFAVREFRGLWSAQFLSVVGDQLARVALAILVYNRTGSALLTALTYALTFLPHLIGGPLLAGLADILPRRRVMIVCDLLRAGLVAGMAVPQVPFAALCALLFVSEVLAGPFQAARVATMPEVLSGDKYVVGTAVTSMTHQATQISGFAVGGAVVAVIGSHNALAVDAATFAMSALIVRLWVEARPAARQRATWNPELVRSMTDGARLVLRDPRLRALAGFAWLCSFYIVPEGLAAPYADTLGVSAIGVGLLMAAIPTGNLVGAFVFGRFVPPSRRPRLIGPLAMLSCAPLIGCAVFPSFRLTLALWGVAGLGAAYQLAANATFVRTVDPSGRGQAVGLVQAGMMAGQGFGILLSGAAAEVFGPEPVVAAAGLLGLIAAALITVAWGRASGYAVPSQRRDTFPAAPLPTGAGSESDERAPSWEHERFPETDPEGTGQRGPSPERPSP
ncbi:MAG: MFS transporter [Nocardioidaceae bacterium]